MAQFKTSSDVEKQEIPDASKVVAEFPEGYIPITVEERTKWEATQKLSLFVKVRNSASDTFTPFQIKFLTPDGRINMGYYGIIALTILFVLTAMNLYGLIASGETNPLKLVNFILPFILSIFMIEKFISGLLNSFVKYFK